MNMNRINGTDTEEHNYFIRRMFRRQYMPALISALTGVPARQDTAMTGEITLRGHVLPIGGVKEKLLAAYRMGITTLLVPCANEKDLTELPQDVRSRLDIHLLKQVDEAIDLTLVRRSDAPGRV